MTLLYSLWWHQFYTCCIIYFAVLQIKPDPGVFAKSFLPNDIMFISTDKLLPLSRFTNPSAGSGAASGGRSSRGGGGGRAMRYVFRIHPS